MVALDRPEASKHQEVQNQSAERGGQVNSAKVA